MSAYSKNYVLDPLPTIIWFLLFGFIFFTHYIFDIYIFLLILELLRFLF